MLILCICWLRAFCASPTYISRRGNIVLLPREVAGLTDHCQTVKELLKYEAWERFRFKPVGEEIPAKPKYYNYIVWKNPEIENK